MDNYGICLKVGVCIASLVFTLTSCDEHFISDRSFRKTVREDFLSKKSEMSYDKAFSVFGTELDTDEREALMFLYAYMPAGDILNHEGSFFLNNYRLTRKALDEMPWGKNIPEREIRHFVLPVRVNNENLDNSREVFYSELKDRIKGMTMEQAVLEVNHWCHEKATYMPSDSRTSSPLATVRTAYGRCGEESTFLVAALRSVGIPARQVYTPRWAHTDDNHAWVEAWVDGKWAFLGACEPEPVLNLGWFNAPASRGMLMHTKVFGKYDGPEEVMSANRLFTEINVIGNYAPSPAHVTVSVVDASGKEVPDASVQFKIYNYAEFYTVAQKITDSEGMAGLTAGSGDMLAIAYKDGMFGLEKISFGRMQNAVIRLDKKAGEYEGKLSFDIVPPPENASMPAVTQEQRDENTRRLIAEDSVRTAYISTFFNDAAADEFASEHGYAPEAVRKFLVGSRGNHAEITAFLEEAAVKGKKETAVRLLGLVSAKDLRDTPKEVLDDHLYNTHENNSADNVLNPRVSSEMLTAYRSFLIDAISDADSQKFRNNPASLVQWCSDSLNCLDDISMKYVQISPAAVHKSRICDEDSRKTYFVAVARSLGISAWQDSVTGNVKYSDGKGNVVDVDFDSDVQKSSPQGLLELGFTENDISDDPKYYSHFSLSKYDEGNFSLLNYSDNTTLKNTFADGERLDCGYYMLVNGTRMADGSVLSDITFFNVQENKPARAVISLRNENSQLKVIGNFNSELKYRTLDNEESSVLSASGRGYFIIGIIDYGKEPTNHALKDISAVKEKFEEWGRPILLLFASEDDCRRFRYENYPDLPSTVIFGIDTDGSIRSEIAGNMKLDEGGRLPLFIMADTFNRIVFMSQGYTIGMGENLSYNIRKLE